MRITLAILIGAAALSSAAAQTARLDPLPIVLPKPLFEGTPEPPNVANLEKPLGRPRPPFLAPAGVANVAQGKLVSSSDSAPVIGNIDMITDGEKAGSDGTFVELKEGPQSVVIDLEDIHTIYAILLWHYHKEARVYLDVIVQVADDPDFITNVRTIFNNDSDNTAGFGLGRNLNYVETAEGKLIDAKGVEARYVRFISNGSNKTKANHYVEIEVYGKPVS